MTREELFSYSIIAFGYPAEEKMTSTQIMKKTEFNDRAMRFEQFNEKMEYRRR